MSAYEDILESKDLLKIKEKAIKTARELRYSTNIIEMIRSAKTEGDVYRVLIDARRGLIE